MKNLKKCFLACGLTFFGLCNLNITAQNTFPSTGAVGIGTTTPSSMLTLRPTGANAFEIRPASSVTTATGEFRLLELAANGTQYVGFKAPSSIGTNIMWVLPSSLGSAGQVLARNSGSDLTWLTVPTTSLNNLTTTSINVDILPNSTGVRNIGSNTMRWNLGYFNGGVLIGNTSINQAGMIRYNGTAFQGFNGTSWVDFSSSSVGANTSLSNLTATSINQNLIPSVNRTLGSSANPWSEVWSGRLAVSGFNVAAFNTTTRNFAAGGGRISTGSTINNNIHIGFNAGGLTSPSEFENFDNVIIGANSGTSITSGFNNVIMGTSAGGNLSSGGGNTLIGHQSGVSMSSGFDNTLIGNFSGIGLGNGSNNAFFGRSAGANILDGSSNVCIGAFTTAGSIEYAATGLTLIGTNAQTNGTWNNATAIGNGAIVAASNRVRIGNTAITRISGQVGFSIDSDRRLKQNVKEYELGLEFINKLRPVSYEYINNPEGGNRQGFIAQEVEIALGKTPFEGLNKPENDKDFYAINYSSFVVPLVNAVKELSEKVKALESQLDTYKLSSERLQNTYTISGKLGQNEPNPFGDISKINYDFSKAPKQGRVIILDLNGRTLQTYDAQGQSGSIIINKGELSSGVYTYLLMDGNEVIAVKQMIVN